MEIFGYFVVTDCTIYHKSTGFVLNVSIKEEIGMESSLGGEKHAKLSREIFGFYCYTYRNIYVKHIAMYKAVFILNAWINKNVKEIGMELSLGVKKKTQHRRGKISNFIVAYCTIYCKSTGIASNVSIK